MNTLQRWTEQSITMSTGQFDARIRKLGNYIRMFIPIMKDSSNVRIVTNGWADPVQIVLDEDVKDNISPGGLFPAYLGSVELRRLHPRHLIHLRERQRDRRPVGRGHRSMAHSVFL